MNLKNSKDELSKAAYGMTRDEAVRRGICIHCRKPAAPKIYSAAGTMEYRISGLCEECFDKIAKEMEEE